MRPVAIVRAVIAVIIVVIAVFFMRYLTSLHEDPPQKEFKAGKRYVKVDRVNYGTVPVEVYGSGRVISGQSIAVLSEVQGRILQGDVPFKAGQSFKKGQLLYRVDATEAAYSLSAQKSQFLNAIASVLPDLKIDYKAAYPTWQEYFKSIDVSQTLPSLPEIDNAQLKTFMVNRGIVNQYYSIKSVEERLAKYRYYAPFTGAFSAVQFEVGGTANPGTPLATIIKTSNLEVEVPVEADEVEWVKKGAKVSASNSNGQQWTGKVVRIAEFLDPETQSISVFVELNDGETALYEGMYLDVVINGPAVEAAYEIPRKAVFNKNNLYTVKDGKLKEVTVNVVKLNRETAVINGLKENETVVVEPLVNVKDGLEVETIQPKKGDA